MASLRVSLSLPALLVCIAGAFPPFAGAGDYPAAVLADNPIAYWRLGESGGSPTAIDQTSNHNGSYGTNVGLGTPGAIQDDPDTAASFTGFASSKVSVDTHPALTPSVFTIELWARLTGPPGAGRCPASYRDVVNENNRSGWQLAVNDAGDWEFRTGRGTVGSGSPWNTIVGPAAQPDTWTHLVGTYDGSDMRFYVDGEPVGELLAVSYLPVDSFFFFIHLFIGAGRNEDVLGNGDLFWVGEVDEVAYYGHALDSATVQQHYATATGAGGPNLETIVGVDRIGAQSVFHWQTAIGSDYRLRRSSDRVNWTDVAAPIAGTGATVSQGDSLDAGASLEFYRVEID